MNDTSILELTDVSNNALKPEDFNRSLEQFLSDRVESTEAESTESAEFARRNVPQHIRESPDVPLAAAVAVTVGRFVGFPRSDSIAPYWRTMASQVEDGEREARLAMFFPPAAFVWSKHSKKVRDAVRAYGQRTHADY